MDIGVVKEIPTSKAICESKLKNFVPGPNDVIIGRGKKCFQHLGNIKLRCMVASKMGQYSAAATKSDKSKIILTVVTDVQQSGPSGGRFVKQDTNAGGLWIDVHEAIAREKVSQAFRDALHDKYKSSNEFKKRKRRVVRCNQVTKEKPLCTHPQKVLHKDEQVDSDLETNDEVTQRLGLLHQSSGEMYGLRKNILLSLSSSLPESSELTQWFENDQSF